MAVDTKSDFARVSAIISSFEKDHFRYGLMEINELILGENE